ncbi:MAG: hypothetical protein RSC68_27320 [Acinetobacter sp.]
MTAWEVKVCNYYVAKGLWQTQFTEEAKLLCYVKEMLGMLGALVVREGAATKNGTSDLIVCYKGMFVAIETKDDIGVPSANQLRFIDSVLKAGGSAAVVRTLAEAMELLLKTPEDKI